MVAGIAFSFQEYNCPSALSLAFYHVSTYATIFLASLVLHPNTCANRRPSWLSQEFASHTVLPTHLCEVELYHIHISIRLLPENIVN